MAGFTWANPMLSALRSRWLWAAVALLSTILIFRSAATADIVSKYAPSRPILGRGDNLDQIRNRTLGFERVFAISLPSRTDQHDAITLAGALLDVDIDIVDGVNGTHIDPKVIPFTKEMRKKPFLPGAMGAWRAHMNVLQKMVRENIQSALIIEGDADWDIRFKDQLVQFAQASRILVQPEVGSDRPIDPTFPKSNLQDVATEFALKDYGRVQLATDSPYGDMSRWDVLWLGHCSTKFTEPQDGAALGRVIIADDETVPQPRWIDPILGSKVLKTSYPNHTRIVHQTTDNICTFAYAVTQKAARALLYECGVKMVDNAMDIMLHDACAGVHRSRLRCLTAQPSYFYQHMANGITSDINGYTTEDDFEPYTRNIRLSSRLNLQQMIFGWDNMTEQWRDDAPGGFD